jgi:uncharacterized protein YdeI (YjbR/CyaY-like superfamily)
MTACPASGLSEKFNAHTKQIGKPHICGSAPHCLNLLPQLCHLNNGITNGTTLFPILMYRKADWSLLLFLQRRILTATMTAHPNFVRRFTALLEPDGTSLKWVIARIPFDVKAAWPGMKRRRVRGRIEGFAFRTSVFPDPRGGGQILLVNKKMQVATGTAVGSRVRIELAPDLEEREAAIGPEFAAALKGERALGKWFAALSESMRREIGAWVAEPKSEASRQKRAEQMAERLMLAMEGERELPPILEAAFQREPKARTGWLAMTPTQRRNQLLGIFYYQNVEARERRVAKAVEEALRAANRAAGRS